MEWYGNGMKWKWYEMAEVEWTETGWDSVRYFGTAKVKKTEL